MKSKTIILINITITLFFIIMISFLLNKNNREIDAWKMAINGNSVSSINSYILNYPKGIFSKSANLKLDEFTWKETEISNSVASYQNYKKRYPNGEFITKADSILKMHSKKLSENLSHVFDKVVGSKIFFKDGHSVETDRYGVEYIGEVVDVKNNIYYIFSGRDYEASDEEPQMYIVSTKQSPYKLSYPGNEKYYETGEVIYKSRAFYGKILDNVTGLVIYQIYYDNKVETTRNCYIVSLENGKINGKESGDYASKLKQTLIFQKKGLCKEIQGKEYTSSP